MKLFFSVTLGSHMITRPSSEGNYWFNQFALISSKFNSQSITSQQRYFIFLKMFSIHDYHSTYIFTSPYWSVSRKFVSKVIWCIRIIFYRFYFAVKQLSLFVPKNLQFLHIISFIIISNQEIKDWEVWWSCESFEKIFRLPGSMNEWPRFDE